MLIALSLFFGVGSAAAEDKPRPDGFIQDRADALKRGPEGLLDLACTLYDRARRANDPVHAFDVMREAADAGNDTAVLYLSAYLRFGVGTKKNEDEADKLLLGLVAKITGKRSSAFPTLAAAAKEIYSGRCGPSDIVTSHGLANIEEACSSTKDSRPAWCT
jgi:hypothetical protein